jgi:ankyrin repeat protein
MNEDQQVESESLFGILHRIREDSNKYVLAKDINSKLWWNHSTILMIAAQMNELELVDDILRHNPNIELTNDIGNTVIHIAAEYGHLAIMQSIIKTFPDAEIVKRHLSQKNAYGQTPLMLAIERDHVEVVKGIIEQDRSQVLYKKHR